MMKYFIFGLLTVSTIGLAKTALIQSKSMNCTKLTQEKLSISTISAYQFCKIDSLKTRSCVQDKLEAGIKIEKALKDCQ